LGLNSLDKTTNFIEDQWNGDVADAFLDKLDERVEKLKMNPHIGPIYEQTNYRQLIIHPLVALYYELKTDYIGLSLVWSNKQNPDELWKQIKRM
jgi:plasmid stabilization system protein ParE